MRSQHFASFLLRCVAVGWVATATTAHADSLTELPAKLTELVQKANLGAGLGAVVADASTGSRLYSLNPETPRNPASNMKLVTAATALSELGAEFRLRTTLAGNIDANGAVDTLVLRGEGDPSLAFSDLVGFAKRLAEMGVHSVEQIVVDGSYFDGENLPPAFDSQPQEVAAFRAAVGAVSVDRNAYELRVAPGPQVGAPASVILRCPDYFLLDASLNTSASGTPTIHAEQQRRGDQMVLKVAGDVPEGIRGAGYERRVESALPYAGYCMRAALKGQRIEGAMRVAVGGAVSGLGALVTHESEPLATLLGPVGKNSDNFYAEMLLKVVGAHATHRPGSSALGAERAQTLLEQAGVKRGSVVINNGSGLFKGGAISPAHLCALLVHMHNEPGVRFEYVSQLAIAGKDGTLKTRLTDLPSPRTVRAKTGTLDDVIALSGYVFGPRGRAMAFSFLFNGVAGKQWQARNLADDMVRSVARALHTP
jgi:D-alanyl-D-alanine carboxypeptidase/D-alanyl-D-alanine-endopeptidase (penicillin-binding protein 4)